MRADAGRTTVGVIGCGNISSTYLATLTRFDHLYVVACGDVVAERAEDQAASFRVPRACTPRQLLDDPGIELVVDLTPPVEHAAVARAALEARKSVYNEKPLALSPEEGAALLTRARDLGLRVGAAPDTFLGDALQAARRAVDEGAIGVPVGALAFSVRPGPEDWHPNPAFFYQPGAGPLFDLGPYYLSALVALLGPIRRVTGSARASFPERLVAAGPLAGTSIPVETPTHVAAVLDFAAGPVGLLLISFDVAAGEPARIEVHGSDGTLTVPDPTLFGGTIRMAKRGSEGWTTLFEAPAHGRDRGIGAAEMAEAMHEGRPHRASGELGQHMLEGMAAVYEASEAGRAVELAADLARPEPLHRSLESRETEAETAGTGASPPARLD